LARRIRLFLCVLLVLLGMSVAAGWAFEVPALKSVVPRLSTMKFNTAAAFIAAGAGIWLAGASGRLRQWSLAPAIFLVLLAALTLCQYAIDVDFGIDQMVFADTGLLTGSGHPGRMSPLSAVAFLSLGFGILLVGASQDRRAISTGHYVSVVAGFVAFLAAAGYAFGAEAFWGIGFYTAMAVHTAIGLIVAVAAMLATRADEGWLSGYSDAPAARSLVIQLVPLALLLPFFLGLVLLLGSGLGAYNAAFGFALFVPSIAIALTVIGLIVAHRARATELELYRRGAALRLTEARYRRVFEQTSDLLLTADLDQVIDDCNPSAAAAVGLIREKVIGMRIADFLTAEDFERTSSMLRQKLEKGGTTRYDVRVRNVRGEWLYWEVNSGLTYDEAGAPVGLHVVARDVTERKRAEEHQQLLINELNHRVKNSLAVVQSIVEQTLRGGGVEDGVREALSGRLVALATAHNVVTREKWGSASLREVIGDALKPFCVHDRCSIEGPDVAVSPTTAVTFGLAVHELATNAAKYGALKNEAGRIGVRWSVKDGRLRWEWQEHGGPKVRPPERSGFGTRMIERGLARQLGGTVSMEFRPEGFRCSLEGPAPVDAAPG